MVRRPLWIVVVLLLAAAAALWAAGQVSWTPDQQPSHGVDLGDGSGTDNPGGGANGAGTDAGAGTETDASVPGTPNLTPLALLAIAGLAGAFAVSGWARRVLGAVLVLAGGFACAQAVAADLPGGFDLLTGRGFALAGGLLLAAAGILVVAFVARLPTMGARYQLANAERGSGDPHKDMWDGLSSGDDPTVDGR